MITTSPAGQDKASCMPACKHRRLARASFWSLSRMFGARFGTACQGDPTCLALPCHVWAVQVAWPTAVGRGGGHGRGAPQQLGRCAWAAGRSAASRPRPARHRGARWRGPPDLAFFAQQPACSATCRPGNRSSTAPCRGSAAAGYTGQGLTTGVCRQADPVPKGGRLPAGGFGAAPAALAPHVPTDLQPTPTRVCPCAA